MRLQRLWWSVLVAAVLGGLVGVTAVAAAGAQFIPILGMREGALKTLGVSMANGLIDYVTLLNARDGGINGVPVVWEECETVQDVTRGVECYERLKAKGSTGATAFMLTSFMLVNALMDRATHDQIPLLAGGVGRSDAADGRVFPYVFPAHTTAWSQTTATMRFIGQRAGGMAQLKGREIVHGHDGSDVGREPLRLLDTQAVQYGFTVQHLAVPRPGLDQKATWLRVQVAQPDWVILSSGGVTVSTALKEAAQVGFPRAKIVGGANTCVEPEMVLAGEAAVGFICGAWWGTGTHFPLIQEMLQYVYAAGKGAGPVGDVGTGPWIRGMQRAWLTAEALRTAMRHFGHQPLTGAQVQWGLDHLSLTAASLKALGVEGLTPPLTLSCRDHEGGGSGKFQQWNGTQWTPLPGWMASDQALVRPLVEASAAKYAQEKGITPRACP